LQEPQFSSPDLAQAVVAGFPFLPWIVQMPANQRNANAKTENLLRQPVPNLVTKTVVLAILAFT
jgi:hypothetical protein